MFLCEHIRCAADNPSNTLYNNDEKVEINRRDQNAIRALQRSTLILVV